MAKNIHERLAKLEQVAAPQLNLAERMREARERRRSMTPEQYRDYMASRAAARRDWAARTPKPDGGSTLEAKLRLALWQSAQWEIERLSNSDSSKPTDAAAAGAAAVPRLQRSAARGTNNAGGV